VGIHPAYGAGIGPPGPAVTGPNPPARGPRSGQQRRRHPVGVRRDALPRLGTVGPDAADTRIAAQLSIEDLAASKIIAKRQEDLKEKAKRDDEAKRKNFKP